MKTKHLNNFIGWYLFPQTNIKIIKEKETERNIIIIKLGLKYKFTTMALLLATTTGSSMLSPDPST